MVKVYSGMRYLSRAAVNRKFSQTGGYRSRYVGPEKIRIPQFCAYKRIVGCCANDGELKAARNNYERYKRDEYRAQTGKDLYHD